MSTKDRLALVLEERQEDVVRAYQDAISPSFTGDREDALHRARAAEQLVTRVHGRPLQPNVELSPPPEPESVEELLSLPPDARRKKLDQLRAELRGRGEL